MSIYTQVNTQVTFAPMGGGSSTGRMEAMSLARDTTTANQVTGCKMLRQSGQLT